MSAHTSSTAIHEERRSYVRNILFLAVVSISVFNTPSSVHAAVIINRPLYSGLTDGLVGSWSFDAPDIAGVIAYDRSGNNNNGTLTGGPAITIGKIGQGLSVSGTGSRADFGNPSALNIQGAISLCTWARWQTFPSSDYFFMGEPNDGDDVQQYSLVIGTDGSVWFMWTNTNSEYYQTAASTIILNKWYHICGVRISDSSVKIYINGIEAAVTPNGDVGVPTSQSTGIIVGTPSDGSQAAVFDDARIYNRVLTADEIKRLYKMGGTFKINDSRKDTLTSGLVGHWTFDAADIAAGTAYDRSGNENNGGLAGGQKVGLGRIGQGLNFNGTSDSVVVANSSSLQLASSFTLSAWVKPTSFPGTQRIIAKGTTVNYYLGYDSSGTVNCRAADFGSEVTSTIQIKLNTWSHVMCVYDAVAQTQTIYIGGIARGSNSQTTTMTTDTDQLHIGDFYGANYVTGTLDDVRIYNRVLSQSEITRLYNMGVSTQINTSRTNSLTESLAGHWTFDGPDVAGVKAYDRSGNGNTGTLTSGPVLAIGKIGQGLLFNGLNSGSGNYVTIPTSSSLDITGDITLATWVKTNAIGVLQGLIQQTDNTTWDYQLDIQSSGALDFYSDQGTPTDTVSTVIISADGQWHHVAVVRRGTTVTFYMDGVAGYSATVSGTFSTGRPVILGADNTGGTARLTVDGLLDDVRIYNRALSADEIERLYNFGK